ncbi:type 4b pilus protein PilO2 [Marinobacter sp. ELB17]|uniref:type 4b pilus protein PilO2 n=1 Tax=Marinobacter sp. ELB17 TaxID=270374 RepID=UPI0000F38345|nr:type 4b pilus protein PilO2 [Marinobacter sp. ELB17]EAZ98157.1 hypothetical protein MELB17_09743 [Marinobacter sp. ELB17]
MSVIALTDSAGGASVDCIAELIWDTVNKNDWKIQKKQALNDKSLVVEIPIIRGAGSSLNVGILNSKSGSGKVGNPSIAAWVARSFLSGTVIAAEHVKQDGVDTVWFCAVRDGQVIAGTDITGDISEIDERVNEIFEMISTEDVGFMGSACGELTANQIGEVEAQPLLFNLSGSLKKKALVRGGSSGTTSQKTLVIIAVLCTILAIVGGSFLYISFSSSQNTAEEARKRKILQMQMAKTEYAALLVETAKKAQGGLLLQSLLRERVGKLEAKLGGWVLQTGACEAQKCTVGYLNTNLTDPAVLREGLEQNCDEVLVSMDGTQGSCMFGYGFGILDDENIKTPEFMEDADVNQFRLALMQYARYFEGSSYAISAASEVMFSKKNLLGSTNVFHTGSWALNVPLAQYPYAIDLLQNLNSISVDKVDLNWGGKNIEIKGLYFKEGIR